MERAGLQSALLPIQQAIGSAIEDGLTRRWYKVVGLSQELERWWEALWTFARHEGVEPTNNAAERALRGFALGRKSWLFAGSDRGADRAAVMATLIMTAKLNDIDPQAWLADVLARIAEHPIQRLDELLPWNWRAAIRNVNQAA